MVGGRMVHLQSLYNGNVLLYLALAQGREGYVGGLLSPP